MLGIPYPRQSPNPNPSFRRASSKVLCEKDAPSCNLNTTLKNQDVLHLGR